VPDRLADAVPMLRSPLESPQNQHVERALEQTDPIPARVIDSHRD
jgi:hypothetical protein